MSKVFRTVRARMLLFVLAVAVPIYSAALYMSYRSAATRLERQAENDADEVAARLAAQLDAVIRPIEGGIRTVAAQLEEIDPPLEQYASRIKGILAAWPEVYGSTIAVEANGGHSDARPFAPYFFRRGGGVEFSDLAVESYSYHELDWYRRAADGQRPVWSLPYFDTGGGDTWMVTYSVPFFRRPAAGGRVLAGVVTADLDLNFVNAAASAVALGPIGMGWFTSRTGPRTFVAPIGNTTERIARFDASLSERELRDSGERMLANGVTFELVERAGAEPVYLAVRRLETLDWRLTLLVPSSELLAEARGLLERQLLLGGAGLVLLVVAVSLVASSISRPIRALARSVDGAREDDFAFRLPESSRGDEVGVLTDALRRMRDSLQRHIQLRAQGLADQARLEHELEIAASIQQSMLPRRAIDAQDAAVQVGAALVPAKRVGGDFYDYFAARDGALVFAIGDVSDKGIPAALFMARVSGLFKVLSSAGELPDRLLAGVNARLVDSNDACMFATMGCGELDARTGLLRYASAGHDAPLILEVGGRVEALRAANGPAIGVEELAEYAIVEKFLAPGDTLVMFTDGVTEAAATDGDLYGLDRLSALLSGAAGAEPQFVVGRVVDAVTAYAALFHATDDLTVLAVTFAPPGVEATRCDDGERWRIELPASPLGTGTARQRLRAILAARDVDSSRSADIELIAEELLTNIARAAAARGADARVTLECRLTPRDVSLTISDDGPPFDPLARERPNLEAEIAERDVGGLGIHLVRQLADSCRYERVDGRNVVAIRMSRAAA